MVFRPKSAAGRKLERRGVRLCLEALEDRFLLATYVWSGAAPGAVWSDKNNWKVAGVLGVGVPGPADTASFDGTNNNDSKMDLQTNVSVLQIQGYNGAISLQRQLILDVLNMSSGTIKRDSTWLGGGGTTFDIKVSQATGSVTVAPSTWTGGNIGGGTSLVFTIVGSTAHPLTFNVGSATSTPTFNGAQWFINAPDGPTTTTVNWLRGNITMTPYAATVTVGPEILNFGTFDAQSTGTISGPAGKTWVFTNRGNLIIEGEKQFVNGKLSKFAGSKTYKRAGLDGTPGTFAVAEIDQEGGYLEIDSGTVQVNGAFTQSDGDTVVESSTNLSVSGADVTLSAGTMEVYGTLSSDGNFLESGGTATVGNGMSGTVTVSQAYTESGGTLAMVSGTVSAGNGVAVQSGAILTGYGTLMAEVSNAGEVDVSPGAMGTLSVTYDYTQTAGTTKIGTAGSSGQARFTVAGVLSEQAGTVNFLAPNYLSAGAGYTIDSGASLIGFGTISATVTNSGTINLTVNNSLYTLQIMGDFTQTSTGALSLSAPNQITISGAASLDGALTVNFVDGYTLQSGQRAKLIGYSSESGSFASVTLPPNTSLSYGATELDLVAA